jgi:hypothetical protein
LAKRAVKIEFEGSDGERYTIKLEGVLSKDKVMRVMDMYELLATEEKAENMPLANTMYGKVQTLILDKFTFKRFTSDELRNAFEDTYDHPIKLAAVSTYLARMSDQGTVIRSKHGRKWLYMAAQPMSESRPIAVHPRVYRDKPSDS